MNTNDITLKIDHPPISKVSPFMAFGFLLYMGWQFYTMAVIERPNVTEVPSVVYFYSGLIAIGCAASVAWAYYNLTYPALVIDSGTVSIWRFPFKKRSIPLGSIRSFAMSPKFANVRVSILYVENGMNRYAYCGQLSLEDATTLKDLFPGQVL